MSPDVRDGSYREIVKATFEEYVTHWQDAVLSEPGKFKPSTYNGYRSAIAHHLLPYFGHWQMQAIDGAAVNTFMRQLHETAAHKRDANLSPKTVRNVITLLGKILTKAVAENYLRFSPMTGVELPEKGRKQKGRALKPDQIRDILGNCSQSFRPMFLTAVLTGMRRAEQFALDCEHIDFERNVVRVERCLYWKFGKYQNRAGGQERYVFTEPKSEKSKREIDLPPQLRAELLELSMRAGGKGLVFRTSKGTPFNPENVVKHDFHEALETTEAIRSELGLDPIGPVRWHDLRHTYGSLLLNQGVDIFYVSRAMGHSSIEVTCDIYGHKIKGKPEAAAGIGALILGNPAESLAGISTVKKPI